MRVGRRNELLENKEILLVCVLSVVLAPVGL